MRITEIEVARKFKNLSIYLNDAKSEMRQLLEIKIRRI